MTPLQWFLAGGPWMWPILLLVSLGLMLTLLAVVLLRTGSAQGQTIRRGIGIALVATAVLCLATGVAGHTFSKARVDAFVEQAGAVNPEVLEIAEREARVILEASVAPGIVFLAVGLLAARRKSGEGVEEGR